jgi:drug/metabolite transporter (DMT)-like permease
MIEAPAPKAPAPWFGIEHGKQWPLWLGALLLGIGLIVIGAPRGTDGGEALAGYGVLILLITNLAGMFVMARRLARRKGRSVGLATVMTLIFGWFAVLVYACMRTPYRQLSFAEEEGIFEALQRQRRG